MTTIRKGFSTKQDGSMYQDRSNPRSENMANRERYFVRLGLGQYQRVAALGAHMTEVQRVDSSTPNTLLDVDGLVTKEADIVLSLTGADCFPVYFEDSEAGVIGLAHCGWRGIVAGIVPKTIETMINLGADKARLLLTIGPGICANHFEIREDVLSQFETFVEYVHQSPLSITVDLKGIVARQAREAGILGSNITDQSECTYCLTEKYFSYRRDKPEYLETQIAYIVQEK